MLGEQTLCLVLRLLDLRRIIEEFGEALLRLSAEFVNLAFIRMGHGFSPHRVLHHPSARSEEEPLLWSNDGSVGRGREAQRSSASPPWRRAAVMWGGGPLLLRRGPDPTEVWARPDGTSGPSLRKRGYHARDQMQQRCCCNGEGKVKGNLWGEGAPSEDRILDAL